MDLDGIQDRIVAFPVPSAQIEAIAAGEANQVWYLRITDGKGVLRRYDIAKRKDDVIVPDANGFKLTTDGKKLLYTTGGSWFLTPVTGIQPGQGRLNLAAADIRIDPRAEWAQIFDEAWRINRDYFYATNYHGNNWEAQRTRYAPFIQDASSRSDVERVIRWLLSELRVGHSFQDRASA